jgi:hypothetical protein
VAVQGGRETTSDEYGCQECEQIRRQNTCRRFDLNPAASMRHLGCDASNAAELGGRLLIDQCNVKEDDNRPMSSEPQGLFPFSAQSPGEQAGQAAGVPGGFPAGGSKSDGDEGLTCGSLHLERDGSPKRGSSKEVERHCDVVE